MIFNFLTHGAFLIIFGACAIIFSALAAIIDASDHILGSSFKIHGTFNYTGVQAIILTAYPFILGMFAIIFGAHIN